MILECELFSSMPGIYTAPRPPPQIRKYPPKPGEKYPPPSHPQKFWYVTEVYKMKNSWKMGEKMGKNQFSIEISVCKF